MASELRLAWEKHRPALTAMFNVSGWIIGVLGLLVSISETVKRAVATPLKAVAPWLVSALPVLAGTLYIVVTGLLIWLIYVAAIKQKNELASLESDLARAKNVNLKLAQRQIEAEQQYVEEREKQDFNWSLQVESLKEDVENLRRELLCICPGNLVADEIIRIQETLEDFLTQSRADQIKGLQQTLSLITYSVKEVTKKADNLLHCAFYLPQAKDKMKVVGWFHDAYKGKDKTDISRVAKGFVEKYRDSRERGFLVYPLELPASPKAFGGIQTLRAGENIFAVLTVIGHTEQDVRSCQRILELFARMAGKLSAAVATVPAKSTPSLIPSRKEASRD